MLIFKKTFMGDLLSPAQVNKSRGDADSDSSVLEGFCKLVPPTVYQSNAYWKLLKMQLVEDGNGEEALRLADFSYWVKFNRDT